MAQIALLHKYITDGSRVMQTSGICLGSSAHDSVFTRKKQKGEMLNAGHVYNQIEFSNSYSDCPV